MKTRTLFDKATQQELQDRLLQLSAGNRPLWGKMNAAQMLAHCTASIQVPLGELKATPSPLRFIGRMLKGMATSDKPMGRNYPTAPEFVISDHRIFDAEKQRFQEVFMKFAQGPSSITCFEHSFFGKLSSDQWGCLMYKHVDHHLRQFGA